MRRFPSVLALVLSVLLVAASCGDDTADPPTTTTDAVTTTTAAAPTSTAPTSTTAAPAAATTAAPPASTTAAPEPLLVLVSNDDGVDAPGIDALVEMLIARGDVEVVVVAPDGNRSGSSDNVTEDGEVTAVDATTASGYPAVAVSGFPADAVIHALEVMGVEPDLVISGINEGANIGPFSELSGTVGAARTGARAGIPAVAASQGLGEPADFPAGAIAVSSWLDDHVDELRQGTEPFVVSINVPTCEGMALVGTAQTPTATDFGDRTALASDCTNTTTDFADDVDAYNNNWVSIAELTF